MAWLPILLLLLVPGMGREPERTDSFAPVPDPLSVSASVPGHFSQPATDSATIPKLAVLIIIDGLPQEQLDLAWSRFPEGGFRRLGDRGAWFKNASYSYATTFTAVGHATIATGTLPPQHGLIANDWLDRSAGHRMYCVEDPKHQLLDEPTSEHAGTSPQNLKASTISDQLRRASGGHSKGLAISIKDRGAILPGGHGGSAYWYSTKTGRFLSSTYYRTEYPRWWTEFHSGKPQDAWFGKAWDRTVDPKSFPFAVEDGKPWHTNYKRLGTRFPFVLKLGLPAPAADYYAALTRTPFGDQLTLDFLTAAVRGEQIGRNPSGIDWLSVSFSSHDYVNHLFGPESIQSYDHLVRLDRMLAQLFSFLDEWVGPDRFVAALTSDHGFGVCPEYASSLGLAAGSLDTEDLLAKLNRHLSKDDRVENYVLAWWNPTFYLDYDLIRTRGLDPVHVEKTAARWLLEQPGVAAVFTRTQLESGTVPNDPLYGRVQNSWSPKLSGDLVMIGQPYWYVPTEGDKTAATHGTPYPYDARVPLMLYGPRIRPGVHHCAADVVDLAPTLSAVLGITPPEQVRGKVLVEALR